MANNIKAVNAFEANKGDSDMENCDYIEYVVPLSALPWFTFFFFHRNSTVPNQPAGVFWAIVASLLIVFQTVILFCESFSLFNPVHLHTDWHVRTVSEIGWPIKFFDRYFPVLGSEFGLGALGIFQCLYAASINQ